MNESRFQIFEDIIQQMMMVYRHDNRPWLVGYSGGTDSTLLVSLIFEAVNRISEKKIVQRRFILLHRTQWLKIRL